MTSYNMGSQEGVTYSDAKTLILSSGSNMFYHLGLCFIGAQ